MVRGSTAPRRGDIPLTIEIPKEKWSGSVRAVTLGATRDQGGTRTRTLTVGGETALPYHAFEGTLPHPPGLALEVHDRKPTDWSPILVQAWGAAMDDPAAWAKAAEAAGADLIYLTLSATLPDGQANTAANARAVLRKVRDATGLPVAVGGPGQAEGGGTLYLAAPAGGEPGNPEE